MHLILLKFLRTNPIPQKQIYGLWVLLFTGSALGSYHGEAILPLIQTGAKNSLNFLRTFQQSSKELSFVV